MDFQCVFWNGRTEKHQTSTARFRLAEENGQHRPFPSLACVLPHPLQNRVPRGPAARWAASRPDRAGRRDKSFCPCQKTGENTGFSPVCFFHVLHGFWVHFGSVFWFPHLSTPAAPLPSTRNAPGFAHFGLFQVRFSLFRCFLAAKFSGCFLYTLPYSGYRLKPSVIPCKREVSFLT